MVDSNTKQSNAYTLGSLPWIEENVRKAYFQSFSETRELIKEHPGFTYHEALSTIQLSLNIFLDSTANLVESIELFKHESSSKGFWMRAMRDRFDKIERSIRQGIFSIATSAKALVDVSRNISNEIEVIGYQDNVDKYFSSNEEHRFIEGLRHYVCHYKMIESNWRVSHLKDEKLIEFLLYPEDLMEWSNWHTLAKNFIKIHPEGINVESLFRNYKIRVDEFQNWFHKGLEETGEPQLSEYRKYERMLNKFGSESLWNVLFSQIIPGKLDPYQYLDLYLNTSELEEVLSLPQNSQRQVDRIIEIVDEYGACDHLLRNKVYAAFKVKKEVSF